MYRFSADGGTNWSYCDIDGNDASTGFDTNNVGVVTVYAAGMAPDLVDYCNIWQSTLTVPVNDPSPLLTIEAFEAGVTDSAAAGTDLEAFVGYGPIGANPAVDNAYNWHGLPYKAPRPGVPNNYEYEGKIFPDGMKPAAGSYDVAVRIRRAGNNGWAYCDTLNSTMDFFTAETADLTVTP